MARSRRGGPRTPRNPAPVSGPGALSARTDGGPSQPIREFPAEHHGQRKALTELQQSAPLNVAGRPPAPNAGAALTGGVFGPTERPNEPVTAGANTGPGPGGPTTSRFLEDNPDAVLQAMYNAYPSPVLLRLMQQHTDG